MEVREYNEDVGTIRLHWREAGEGPVALLLHGFPQTNRCWDRVMERLAPRMRLVAPCLRGYPPSEAPAGVAAYALDRIIEDLIGLIDRVGPVPAGPVALAGHDWGGVIAWSLAARHPERFNALCILDAPHPDLFLGQVLGSPRQMIKSWYLFMFQIPGLAERILGGSSGRALRDVFVRSARRPGAFEEAALDHYVSRLGSPGALVGPLNYYRAAFRQIVSGDHRKLPPITIPTTVVWGARDHALGLGMTAGLERRVRAPYERVIIEDCGHWTPEEAPDEVARELARRFPDAVPGRPPS